MKIIKRKPAITLKKHFPTCRAGVFKPFTLSTVFMLSLLFPNLSMGIDANVSMDMLNELRLEDNYITLDDTRTLVETDATYNLLSFYPSLFFESGKGLEAHLTAEIIWLGDIAGETETENESDLSLVYAYLAGKRADTLLKAGLIDIEAGQGFLFSNTEPGVSLATRISPKLKFSAQAAAVYHESPFLNAELSYQFRFLEDITLMTSLFIDKDDSVADFFEIVDSNTGTIFWGGGMSHFFLGNFYVSLLGLVQKGSVSLEYNVFSQNPDWNPQRRPQITETKKDIDLSGYLVNLDVGANLSDTLSVSLYCLAASGNSASSDDHFDGMVLLMPEIDVAPVFFEGAGDQTSKRDALHFLGILRDGIITPGIKLDFSPNETVYSSLSFTLLYPEDAPDASQDIYGWETDLSLWVEWKTNRSFFIEAGMFMPKNYFSGYLSDISSMSLVKFGFYMAF